MKIYTKIVLDPDGKIVEERSFEYKGPVAQCKGGGGQKQAAEQAEKSFQLQKEMFEHQKQEALKLEQGKESEEAKAAAIKQRGIDIKRQGRSSTILTQQAKPGFSAFQAKDPFAAPKELRDPTKIPSEKRGVLIRRDVKGRVISEEKDALLNKAEIDAANKAESERLAKVKELQSAHNIRLRTEFDKILPFKRRALGAPPIKRRKLSAGNS
jgi:hypothetical protein